MPLLLLVFAALACNMPGAGGGEGGSQTSYPEVKITAPENGVRVLLGQELAIEATSTHPNGVARVELWVDGVKYGSETNPDPAKRTLRSIHTWDPSTVGQHKLEVRVYGPNASTAGAASQIIIEVVASAAQLTATPRPGASGTPGLPATPSPSPSPTPTGTPTSTLTPTPGAVGGMVFVPGGTFIQGRDDGPDDEKPAHSVLVSDFYIDASEVTTSQFKAFVAATGYKTTSEKRGDANNWRAFDQGDQQNKPVRWMSWEDARSYCQWAGKRLPSEAEWEKAARGTGGRLYPWGNEFVDSLVARGEVADVGSFANASPYGALDMSGNVWEWVFDWYDAGYYWSNPNAVNPFGPSSGVARVLRGGSYTSDAQHLTAAYRHSGGPEGYAQDHGFRCAK